MNEIQVYEGAPPPMALSDVKAQVNLIQQIMREVMQADQHYGIIPGTSGKPSLLKPGAEKLIMTFRLVPDVEELVIDLPNEHREYRVKVRITTQNGIFLGSGVGSCTTMEGKYRYRTGPSELTNKPVPKEYWDLRKEYPAKAQASIGGKGYTTKKNDTGAWVIAIQGDKIEHENPADYYNCVTPETKILTHDLRWIPAGEIETGDILIGVGEEMTDQYSRNLATGEATVYGRREDTVYELNMDDGRTVRSNGEHRWLVKKVGLKGTEWVSTEAIYREMIERSGRPRHWSIMSLCSPWEEDRTKESGYLAGLFDADGSLGTSQIQVLFSQQDNLVLSRMEAGLEAREYIFTKSRCKTSAELERCNSKEQVYGLGIRGGFPEQMRLLGSIRPPRLLDRWLTLIDLGQRRLEGRGSGAGSPARIKTIERIGTEEIVMLGTSCGTYIAEGLVAHNTCLKMAKKRALVDACLTVTAASDIFTQDIDDMPEEIPGAAAAQSATAKPPIQQPAAKKDNGKPQLLTAQGMIEEVSVKEGTGQKGPWKKYGVKIGDAWFGTFDTKIGDMAMFEKGHDVAVSFTSDGRFNSIVELVPFMEVPENEQAAS